MRRYHINAAVDVPIPPWITFNDRLKSVRIHYKDIAVQDPPHRGPRYFFRVYYTQDVSEGAENIAINTYWPNKDWNGDLVVFRCSVQSRDRLVNMRTGDEHYAMLAIDRYASMCGDIISCARSTDCIGS